LCFRNSPELKLTFLEWQAIFPTDTFPTNTFTKSPTETSPQNTEKDGEKPSGSLEIMKNARAARGDSSRPRRTCSPSRARK